MDSPLTKMPLSWPRSSMRNPPGTAEMEAHLRETLRSSRARWLPVSVPRPIRNVSSSIETTCRGRFENRTSTKAWVELDGVDMARGECILTTLWDAGLVFCPKARKKQVIRHKGVSHHCGPFDQSD